MLRRLLLLAALTCWLALAACGDATPVAKRPANRGTGAEPRPTQDPPDDPVPTLRTGTLAPIDSGDSVQGQVLMRHVADGIETLATSLPADDFNRGLRVGSVVSIDGATSFSFASRRAGEGFMGGATVWVRRPASSAGSPLDGDLFLSAPGTQGKHVRFHVSDTKSKASDPRALQDWLTSLALSMAYDPGQAHGPWQRYAAQRLNLLAEAMKPKPPPPASTRNKKPLPKARVVAPLPRPQPSAARDDLSRLMETTTGATAVQEALQQDRSLFIGAARQNATIPIASLKLPLLARHPWKDMTAKLGVPVPAEPLATYAPADFYYMRAADLSSLIRLLDALDDWGTPAASIAAHEFEDRALAGRYEAQLGLERSALARALGGAVIGEVGIVGSDPYVKEGSDVTLILRVKRRPLLEMALAATLGDYEKAHGPLARTTREHSGVTVAVARSADGAVAQQRASLDDVEIVSNSPAAIDAVIDTSLGKRPRLSDELDFRFMLARDARTSAGVLAYMGDRFVAAVVGPKQKVLEARREIALAELMTPGFAALLHGWMYGTSPANTDELFARGLLEKEDLSHASGGAIVWSPGRSARSSWGTPASLTPLIDLTAPDLVTEMERAGYERFARTYQSDWSGYIDPIALRVAIDGTSGGTRMTLDLRELPLIDGTDYRRIDELVGAARFTAGPLTSGIRGIFGLGADSWPRKELEQTIRTFSQHGLKLDWIGDWAMIGMADRAQVATSMLQAASDEVPQLPILDDAGSSSDQDSIAAAAQLPLFAEIGINNSAGAAVAIAGLRFMAEGTIPDMFEWGQTDRYRDVPIVKIMLKGRTFGAGDVAIFYAVCKDALLVSLKDWVLRRRIDDRMDGRGPDSAPAKGAGLQVLFDLASDRNRGLWTALSWATEKELLDADRGASAAIAEALLRGAPEAARDGAAERALAFAYFGAAPLTPDGGSYTLSKQGVVDPVRGTSYAPSWPAVPVTGSPLEKVTRALMRVRTELSFDDEGKDNGKEMRSLHARATLDLR